MTELPPDERPDAPARKRAELGFRIAVVLVVLWAIGMSLAVLYGLVLLRSTQLQGVQRSKDTLSSASQARRAADRIEECTTPGKPCYQQGQRQTAKAVGDIGKFSVYASACAVGVDPDLSDARRVALTQKCVLARLAKDKR